MTIVTFSATPTLSKEADGQVEPGSTAEEDETYPNDHPRGQEGLSLALQVPEIGQPLPATQLWLRSGELRTAPPAPLLRAVRRRQHGARHQHQSDPASHGRMGC